MSQLDNQSKIDDLDTPPNEITVSAFVKPNLKNRLYLFIKKIKKNKPQLAIGILIVVILLSSFIYLAIFHKSAVVNTSSSSQNSSSSKQGISSSGPKNNSTSASANNNGSSGLLPPSIPENGAYLGAWINPSVGTGIGGNSSGNSDANELTNLDSFNQTNGKPVQILHVWNGFKVAVPTATLSSIAQNGSIPLIDWGCTDVNSISSGAQDGVINSFADGLKSYNKPVFLRWYWEVNEMGPTGKTPAGSGCNGYNNGPGYIAAWQHIYNLFKADGATNVAFVWCPGYSGGNFATYYPGDSYVDWIGIDRYERTSNNQPLLDFNTMFSNYYNQWAGHGKPIMVAETAAMGAAYQSQYLSSILSEAPQLPDIKAVVYFDSIGPAGDWSLTGSGTTAYSTLSNSSYFSYTGNR